MRWLQLEYLGKGVFLGLLLFTALQQPAAADLELQAWCLLGGLGAGLALAAVLCLRQGYRVKGQWLPFLLFLLLENPGLAYLGILSGMAVGALLLPKHFTEAWLLPATLIGGAVLGLSFPYVRLIQHRWTRVGISLALAAAPVAAIIAWQFVQGDFLKNAQASGFQLLLGLPFFYLLTFAGRAEETEVEIGAVCAILGLGLWLWQPLANVKTLALILPVLLYLGYTARYLPRLRVFKHTLRGLSYAGAGKHRLALRYLRRALELDPTNRLAKETLWAVHRSLNLVEAAKDPEMAALIDPNHCLNRSGELLVEARPTPDQVQEANNLLDFVLNQRPNQRPTVLYWRAVAHIKTGQLDQAAQELTEILDPSGWVPGDAHRESILLQAWQLALILHPEMQRRVGTPQLAIPGRRMEAIGVVERRLAENPDNPMAWDLKRLLYAGVTEAEYNRQAPAEGSAADFDHAYVHQLGLALIADPNRWQRGAELLRIAARGLPAQGPSIYVQIAQAADRAGDSDAAWQNYQRAQQVGKLVGPKNLPDEDRKAYFGVVKMLAEDAVQRNDLDTAIESYSLLTQSKTSGIETLRILAELYAKKKDQVSILHALRLTEQALSVYNSDDKDFLAKKDSYYYSVMPEILRANLEPVRKFFDVEYCLRKARGVLDSKAADLDLLDWALHLVTIARVVQPDNLTAKVLEARARLRKGERDQALVMLEDLREQKPATFASSEDEEAWYLAQRILGDLYLNELARPDLAIGCYVDFRKSSKSGADTLYKLGQAYEAVGDLKKAKRYYEQVTAYDGHPLAPEAQTALYRLQAG